MIHILNMVNPIKIKKENIMKKRFAVLVLCMVFVLSAMAFVACDKKDNIEVKVYSVSSVHDESPELKNTIKIKKGSTFSKSDYSKNYVKDNQEDGNVAAWGFYLDSACTKKHHDDNIIEKDTTFYLLNCSFGSAFIVFNYENKEYYCYIEDTTAKLSADTFAISAYGKAIDSSKLKYFSDKEMTQEIELVGKSFDEITVEADGPIPYSIKEIYVKVS